MYRGLMNPENMSESGGGFQEGMVHILKSRYKVIAPPARQGQEARAPFLALSLGCHRLDEDTQEPVIDEATGEAKMEEVNFSLGGKSLNSVHPGGADSMPTTDEEARQIEDLGDEPDTEGPTLYIVKDDFRINMQSPIAYFAASLHQGRKPKKDSPVPDEFSGCGCPPEVVDVPWAPQFEGLVCHIRNFQSHFKMEGRPMTYKIVDKIISAPWEKKKTSGGAKKAAASAGVPGKPTSKTAATALATSKAESNGGAVSEAEQALLMALTSLSASKAGEKLSVKALWQAAKTALEEMETEKKLVPQALGILMTKAQVWLPEHAGEFDATVVEEGGKVVAVEFGG